MNIFNLKFFTIFIYFGLYIPLQAQKMCIADASITQQQQRYYTQGIVTAYMQEKMIFSWPVKVCECWISSLYGKRKSGFHNGVDFAAIKGTDVFAAADGYVIIAEKNSTKNGFGTMILMEHEHKNNTYKTRYAHLDSIEKNIYYQFHNGNEVFVHRGEKIGTVGSTGHVIAKNSNCDPSHLHFEIYKNDQRIDPLIYLFASQRMLMKNKRAR